MNITDRLKNKRILIWGYGREGKSTERFLKEYCEVASIDILEGKENEIVFEKYDYVIKSPGIKNEISSEKYISQTELLLEQFGSQVIGITGTKGKSTTSSLLYHTLKNCLDHKVFLVGNIGFPCLDYYGDIEEDSVIVYEMSCHQLCDQRFSPHIGVFLNLFEDHLDRYITRENYFAAKKGITNHQTADDYLFVGENVPELDTKANVTVVTLGDDKFDLKIDGIHNQLNAKFVYRICTELFGCSDEAVREAFKTFEGLKHRLQKVMEIDGVTYYNDSISTIPEATIAAIKSLPNVSTVLIGGMDRGIHYDCLVDFIKTHSEYKYVMMYASGKRVCDEAGAGDLDYCYYADELEGAVKIASEIAPKGTSVVMSPAAASYGYFKDFEARGEKYMELVRGLANE